MASPPLTGLGAYTMMASYADPRSTLLTRLEGHLRSCPLRPGHGGKPIRKITIATSGRLSTPAPPNTARGPLLQVAQLAACSRARAAQGVPPRRIPGLSKFGRSQVDVTLSLLLRLVFFAHGQREILETTGYRASGIHTFMYDGPRLAQAKQGISVTGTVPKPPLPGQSGLCLRASAPSPQAP